LLAYEYAPESRKALYACVPMIGAPLGMVLATFAMIVMGQLPDSAFVTWGWRVPFLASAALVLLGLWIRKIRSATVALRGETQISGRASFPVARPSMMTSVIVPVPTNPILEIFI